MSDGSFRNKLRLRVCGLLVTDDAILLAQVHSPVTDNLIWTPPGGGLQFGEHLQDCLKREFSEEADLEIEVGNLIHINELIEAPFHAVELYFEIDQYGGEVQKGHDPELAWDQQLLHDLKWISLDQLNNISFAPKNLLPKIRNWDQRSDFSIF